MNNLKTNPGILEKIKTYSWAIVLFLALVATYQTCSTSKKVAALKSKIDQLPTKEEVSKQIQIEGFKTSKRMLYDNNAIIRTTIRPDDRMNEYDQEIKKVEAGK
jgi:hypothetical protein